jgi:hypothetical protein
LVEVKNEIRVGNCTVGIVEERFNSLASGSEEGSRGEIRKMDGRDVLTEGAKCSSEKRKSRPEGGVQ